MKRNTIVAFILFLICNNLSAQEINVNWSSEKTKGFYCHDVLIYNETGLWTLWNVSLHNNYPNKTISFYHFDKNLKFTQKKKITLPSKACFVTLKKDANSVKILLSIKKRKKLSFLVYNLDKDMNIINSEIVFTSNDNNASNSDIQFKWNLDSSRIVVYNTQHNEKLKNWNENQFLFVLDKEFKLTQKDYPHLDFNNLPFTYVNLMGFVNNRYIISIASTFKMAFNLSIQSKNEIKSWILCYDLQTKQYKTLEINLKDDGLTYTKFIDINTNENESLLEIYGAYSFKSLDFTDGFFKFSYNIEKNSLSDIFHKSITGE